MTEDTSPENLRKFLESDDPAMRMMGLSMAKASYIPKELYQNVFGLSLWDPEKENCKVAGKLVEEIGLENIPEFPKWLEPFEEEDVDYEIREGAALALGKIGDARAVEPLIKALGDEDSPVSMQAVGALAMIGVAHAVKPLIKALGDDNEKVRWHATGMLGNIGDTRAVEPLIKALRDEDIQVRSSAAESLGKFGEARAVEPLIKTLRDENKYVRQDVATALGKIGDARAVGPLVRALRDDSGDIWVAKALKKLGHEVK